MAKQHDLSRKLNTAQAQARPKGKGALAPSRAPNQDLGVKLTDLSAEAQASVLRRLDPVQRQRAMLNVHRTQGNQYVQRLLAAWQSTHISATQGATVQRSPLSTELQGLWNPTHKDDFFTRLRNLTDQERQDADLQRFVSSQLQGDDRWLAERILQHGPEPLWPAAVLEERHARATQNQWAPEPGRIAGTLGITAQNRRVEAYYFPGISAERALIIGGMHGSELSAVAVAEELVNTLRSDQAARPYYTVIIVPRLFPDNVALAERTAVTQPSSVNSPANIGRYTRQTPTRSVDPNRQFPAAGAGFDPADPRDARHRAIEAENVMLLALIQRFQPTRVANLHAIRTPQSAGIYADPRTNATGIACGFAPDRDLALAMAARAEQLKVRVPGNRRSSSADVNAIYPLDPQAAPAGGQQARSNNEGTSFGTWGTTAVSDAQHPQANRPAMTVITVEVAGAQRASDVPAAQQAARQAEISGHVTVLQEIFLGPPGAGGRPAAPPPCPPQAQQPQSAPGSGLPVVQPKLVRQDEHGSPVPSTLRAGFGQLNKVGTATPVLQRTATPAPQPGRVQIPTLQRDTTPASQPAAQDTLTAPLTEREWELVYLWLSRGEVGIDPLTDDADHNADLMAAALFCQRALFMPGFGDHEDPLLCVLDEVTIADPRVQRLKLQVTARGPIVHWPAVPTENRLLYVMNLLVDTHHYPVNGAAGIVGNLLAESGVLPSRVEGSAAATPMRAQNRAGAMTDFTPDEVMNRSNTTGPRLPGVGLAQWTTAGRRAGLFQRSSGGRQLGSSILFNMDAQVEYLVSELQGRAGLNASLMAAGVTLNDASDNIVYQFEIPGSILNGTGGKLPRTHPAVQAVFAERRTNSQRALRAYQAAHAP